MPLLLLLAGAPAAELSLFEILSLVGFATGAALHLYLCWVLYHHYGLRRAERSLLSLGLVISFWHLGNFAGAVYLSIGPRGGLWWLKLADLVAYLSLACIPPTMAHAHFKAWGWFDDRVPRKLIRGLTALGYLPLVVLGWVAPRLWQDPYLPPAEKLAPLLLPFIVWFVLIFLECAAIDWRLARQWQSAREKKFFRVLGGSLAVNGSLFLLTYVLGGRRWGAAGDYLDLVCKLSSVMPTAIVAYYIYRYRYLELVIRQSFVYAILAAAIMMVYIFGIRRLSRTLEANYGVRGAAIEAMLILVVIFLAGPLRQVAEGYLQRLFAREVGLYRQLVAQVGAAAADYGDLARFLAFAEMRLRESLELRRVRILPRDRLKGYEDEVGRLAEERQWTEVEDRQLLNQLGVAACYPLWREGRVAGLMLVEDDQRTLSAEKREVLHVLAGHIAVAVENCLLLDEKVNLERDLAERERLASLGQMAATVAHEVKNPLSAIKSIAQVMREDEEVGKEYGRDLELIIGEVDRLNRSVSQLLSFSRPAVAAAMETPLEAIFESVLAILRPGAQSQGIAIEVDLAVNPRLPGEQANALQEALLNLGLNAIQAIKGEGRIVLQGRMREPGMLVLSVTDDGQGIPAAMHEKIFEPFFTTRQRGTGLGLAIVARRVQDLGGSVGVTSPVADGHGARFELAIPV